MSSSYNGLVALDTSNQKGVRTVVLKRGVNVGDNPNTPEVTLKRLEGLPKGTALNPYNFNIIAFDTNVKLKKKGEQLTIDHLRAVLKKLGDDAKVWVSPCWKSFGKPPKLNIAKASETSNFGSRKSSVEKFDFGYTLPLE